MDHGLQGGGTGADLAVDFLSFGGKIACDVFVLITGYFMIKSRFRIRGILRLVFETLLYSWAIFAIFAIATNGLGVDGVVIDFRRIQAALLPIASNEYWFVTTFIVMMALIPIQNLVFTQLSPKGRFTVASIGFLAFSVVPTMLLANSYTSNVVWFCYLYFIGGYIRYLLDDSKLLNNPPVKVPWLNPAYVAVKFPLGTTILALLVLFASMVFLNYLYVKIDFTLISTTWFIGQNTLPAFFAALGLFCVFNNLSIPYVAFINKCGGSVFGVYLVHDNPIIRNLFWPHFESVYAMGGVRIIFVGLLCGMVILAACLVIDVLRIRFIETPFMAAIDKKFGTKLDAIDNAFDLKKRICG